MSHSYHRPPPLKKNGGKGKYQDCRKYDPSLDNTSGVCAFKDNMTSGRQVWTISVYVIGMFPSGPSDKMPSWRNCGQFLVMRGLLPRTPTKNCPLDDKFGQPLLNAGVCALPLLPLRRYAL